MSIWRICFSSARYACNSLCLSLTYLHPHAIAGLNRRYRPRLLRIVGMKLKSEICGREVCKPATAKTRRIPIAGNTEPDRGIVERTPTPRRVGYRRIGQFNQFGKQLPFPLPSQLGRENWITLLFIFADACFQEWLGRRRLATIFTRTTQILGDI